MNGWRFRCDGCGRFIAVADVESGNADHYLLTPDSFCTSEEWITECAKCKWDAVSPDRPDLDGYGARWDAPLKRLEGE